tara:strand:+ start:329 stop:895 length:567 start_codon:yes stop_codon:yes gene_type:complete
MKKKIAVTFILFFLLFLIIFYQKNNSSTKKIEIEEQTSEEISSNSNILENVRYVSKDTKGNEYIITAETGEIDYSNPDIIFLENVNAIIKLINANTIKITSDFGKYNSSNFDTIFSKNVIVIYLDNKIVGEYLDFSTTRETMIISKKVIYTNAKNILKADVVEIDIETKDTKIFMYDKNEQVNIQPIK